MPTIRAAFFDIDGTLLPFGHDRMPAPTVAALQALRRRGVGVYIATGRPPVDIDFLTALRAVEFDGFVTMNGQYCYEHDPDAPFYSHPMPPEALRALVPWLAWKHLPVAFLERGFTYANCVEATGNGIVEPDVPVLDPVRALTRTTYQLSAFISPEWEGEFLRHCPGCVAVRWNDQFADILPAGGGKDAGLRAMLAHKGLDPAQAIAFGDARNDIPMLRAAGIGVAMGNADDAVKAAADFVTAADVDDGIGKALRKMGLI